MFAEYIVIIKLFDLFIFVRHRDEHEVAIVYFRAGYSPTDYPTENVNILIRLEHFTDITSWQYSNSSCKLYN